METAHPSSAGPPSSSPRHLFLRVRDKLAEAGGGDLLDYISARRMPGHAVPYRRIAIDLTNLTGVDISNEAPRRWYEDYLKQIEAATLETGVTPS